MSNFASGYIKYINHIEQINEAAMKSPDRMIEEVEGAYHDNLKNIARNITELHCKAKIAMLSGPSSSGKTTTAHLLKKYLADFGIHVKIVSLDNFYRGRDETPLLPNGKSDLESVEALDIEKIQSCLKSIVEKGSFSVPQYSFALGHAESEKHYEVKEDDIIIIEGIHALNPIFTNGLPEENLIKLYVSVKQRIKDVNGEVISPLDLRLVRRMVRDVWDRDTVPEWTLDRWDSVIDGENLYIRPYRITADYTINSIHIYEPCVLRNTAITMLRGIAIDSVNYSKARDLESRLMRFESITDALVPETSMLREFLGPKESE